jgi:hypothetical protein
VEYLSTELGSWVTSKELRACRNSLIILLVSTKKWEARSAETEILEAGKK